MALRIKRIIAKHIGHCPYSSCDAADPVGDHAWEGYQSHTRGDGYSYILYGKLENSIRVCQQNRGVKHMVNTASGALLATGRDGICLLVEDTRCAVGRRKGTVKAASKCGQILVR